jgi:HK97 family phage major capsid protein
MILGKIKGEDAMTVQAYRFPIEKFTEAQARKWLKDNKIEPIAFEPAEPEEKSMSDELDELKIGARHSSEDQTALQNIHDAAITLGAACPDPTRYELPKSLTDDMLVNFGDPAVKVLSTEGTKTKVGGYLIRFTTPKDPDLEGDYFDKETDYVMEFPGKSITWFNHRLPVETSDGKKAVLKRRLSDAELSVDDIGVFMAGVLDESDAYEKFLADLARAGKLGLSSGTARHLVESTPQKNGINHIDLWPIGLDASYTHAPAESRNRVVALKSLLPDEDEAESSVAAAESSLEIKTVINPNLKIGEIEMDEKELNAVLDARDAARKAEDEAKATKAAELKAAEDAGYQKGLEQMKNLKRGGYAYHKVSESTEGEDEEVKSFLHWIKTGDDVPYKAAMQGQTDSEGGYAVPDDFHNQIVAKRNEASVPDMIGVQRFSTNLDKYPVPVEATAATKFVVAAEEVAYDENEPTLGQVAITIHKMTKLIKISEELEADAQANFGGYLAGVWGRAMAAADNYYCVVTGTGTGMPQAMAVGGALGKTFANAASIVAADIHALIHAMPDPYVEGMVLITSRAVLGLVRALLVATPYAFIDWIGGNKIDPAQVSPSGTIGGVPVFTTNAMPTAVPVVTGTKTWLLVNPSFYGIAEREGMTVSRNPYLYQANGQIGLFAKYRAGGAVLQSEAVLWGIQA